MRPLVLLLLGLVALGAAWAVVSGTGSSAEPVHYLTAVADRGPITTTVTATGTINPVNSVQVGTYVSGPIQKVAVDYNSPIHRGQLLAKIDPRPFQMKLDAATAQLANARAQLTREKATADLKTVTLGRMRALRARGIVAQSELDVADSEARQSRAQIALAEAQVQAAEANQREAEVNLAYTDIVAPVDGVVVARNVSVGQTVAASFQTPVLFLVAGDLARMQVVASVSESDIGGVTAGQTVTFTVDAYPGDAFRGVVAQVRNAPINVQNVVTYEVIVAVENADLRLRPGMTANVAIVTAARAEVVRVPSSALRFRPPGAGAAPPKTSAGVWELDGDTPQALPVQVGIADDRFTEITAGLDAGRSVIVGIDHPGGGPASRGPSFAPAGGGRRR